MEVLVAALTEVDDTGLMMAVGIIEDVLEAERIRGVGVFVIVFRINQRGIVRRIVDQYQVSIAGHTTIRRNHPIALCSAACRYPRRMRAVCLRLTVNGMADSEQGLLPDVIPPDIKA